MTAKILNAPDNGVLQLQDGILPIAALPPPLSVLAGGQALLPTGTTQLKASKQASKQARQAFISNKGLPDNRSCVCCHFHFCGLFQHDPVRSETVFSPVNKTGFLREYLRNDSARIIAGLLFIFPVSVFSAPARGDEASPDVIEISTEQLQESAAPPAQKTSSEKRAGWSDSPDVLSIAEEDFGAVGSVQRNQRNSGGKRRRISLPQLDFSDWRISLPRVRFDLPEINISRRIYRSGIYSPRIIRKTVYTRSFLFPTPSRGFIHGPPPDPRRKFGWGRWNGNRPGPWLSPPGKGHHGKGPGPGPGHAGHGKGGPPGSRP